MTRTFQAGAADSKVQKFGVLIDTVLLVTYFRVQHNMQHVMPCHYVNSEKRHGGPGLELIEWTEQV
jgi:hypothetical protein